MTFEYKLSLTSPLNVASLGIALDDDGGDDGETAVALVTLGRALECTDAVPNSVDQCYLVRIERCVCLETRELLKSTNLRDLAWEPLKDPLKENGESDEGFYNSHLVLATGFFVTKRGGEVNVEKGVRLLLARHRGGGQYSTRTVCKDAERAFQSVGHRFFRSDVNKGWSALLLLCGYDQPKQTEFVMVSLGYVGDALAALNAVGAIRLQNNASPLLRAVASPSSRVSAAWNAPNPETDASKQLNAGQLAALRGLRHNLEAVTGPPGTGKSTLISAVVTECVPRGEPTLVCAVQNRAIESIVQKLAKTAKTTPFVVYGNEKRLSPDSKNWTETAQAKRDPDYLKAVAKRDACAALRDGLQTTFDAFEARVFPTMADPMRRRRKRLWDRLERRLFQEDLYFDDVLKRLHSAYEPSKEVHASRNCDQLLREYKKWFESGGGDGWAVLMRRWMRTRRFARAGELHEFLGARFGDLELRTHTKLQEACVRVCERADALVCTAATVGGLVRATPSDHGFTAVQSLAMRCSTLVVDEAGTCADTNIVATLPKMATGGTFCRTLLVGDSAQLPPFSRLNAPPDSPDAVVSLIERVHRRVGSAMLQTQYRMFERLCSVVSALYYDGQLCTGKADAAGELRVHHVNGTAETATEHSKSLFNDAEAERVVELAKGYAMAREEVAVLAFYKAQVWRVKERLEALLGKARAEDINVMTVDAAQGQEFEHVVLSCVVDGTKRSFLEDHRRMNVAISRAKRTLDVVAHPVLTGRLAAVAALETSASGGHVAIGRPVSQGYPIGRGRGRFGRSSRGRGHARG